MNIAIPLFLIFINAMFCIASFSRIDRTSRAAAVWFAIHACVGVSVAITAIAKATEATQ